MKEKLFAAFLVCSLAIGLAACHSAGSPSRKSKTHAAKKPQHHRIDAPAEGPTPPERFR